MYILNSFVASSRTFSNFADDKYYVHTVASHKHSTKFNVHSVIFYSFQYIQTCRELVHTCLLNILIKIARKHI